MYCRKEVTFQLTYREDEITMIPKDNCAEIFKYGITLFLGNGVTKKQTTKNFHIY